MKTALSLCLGLVLVGSAHAQVMRPRSGGGEHGTRTQPRVEHTRSHHGGGHTFHGSGHSRYDGGSRGHYTAGHYHRPHYSSSYRGSYGRLHVPFYYDYPSHGYYPGYSYYGGYGAGYPHYGSYGSVGYDGYWNGSGAANGLVLGALAGGIIGNNSGTFRHDAWRGAAWGAGVGWLLGAIADSNRRVVAPQQHYVVPQQQYLVPQQVASPQPAVQTAPQQVTVINNYYPSSTPMSGANALFGRN